MHFLRTFFCALATAIIVVTITAEKESTTDFPNPTTADNIKEEVTEYVLKGRVPKALSDKYIVTLVKLNWYAAYAYCEQNNWRLLRIETAKKQFEVENYLNFFNLHYNDYWIAGNNFAELRKFRWDYDGPSFTHTNWAFGEPNKYRDGEYCVKLLKNSLQWGDDYCFNSYNFICERE